uniref:glycosyltransferase family 4 protein n=1 Tax=Sapientia aquatica TaxID=1549640 RepID=UPI001D0D8A59|nr:glycosyltransferase family 4 protein [Sapientia aquatica]
MSDPQATPAKIRLLTLTTLYPNAEQINHGIFVETRLRFLLTSGQVEAKVMAPVPWFPLKNKRFGRYASFARVPASDQRSDISITHPRYALIPKIGMYLTPFLMAQSLKGKIAKLIESGHDFDLIDAHYFYPDGVAAMLLGKHFNKPVVITARGTDINVIAQTGLAKKMVLWAVKNASAVITVCQALKDELVKLGASADKITPLRNGVDLSRFYPAERDQIRAELGLTDFTLLTVGSLTTHKGHDLVIQALALLPGVHLMIAGSGPEDQNLRQLAAQLGVTDRIKFLGSVAQKELFRYYNAADVMVLASSREGWANVLLESMACGTPVISSNVGGSSEVITAPDAGVLLAERSAQHIAAAVQHLQSRSPTRAATRAYAEKFSWDDTTEGQLRLFKAILHGDSTC